MSTDPHDTGERYVPAEFDCCECARHIVVITAATIPEIRLCAACQTIPCWYRDPRVREILDPEHDGLEIWEREAPR